MPRAVDVHFEATDVNQLAGHGVRSAISSRGDGLVKSPDGGEQDQQNERSRGDVAKPLARSCWENGRRHFILTQESPAPIDPLHDRRNRDSHHPERANQFAANHRDGRQQELFSPLIGLAQDRMTVIETC